MAINQFIYPMDLTGERSSNRVVEKHVIGTDRYRAFSLKNGPFYTKNLVVRVSGSNTPLKRGADYECVFYYENVARMTSGLEVCGVIVIHNTKISNDITVEANVVGGPYAASASAIKDAIDQLELDNRNVYWANVIAKPDLFQPTPHLHDLGDIYGFEFIIDLLGAIRDAILVGDNAKMEQIRDHLDSAIAQFNAKIKAHLDDKSNPHEVTAAQVNAYTKEAIDQMIVAINKSLADQSKRMNGIDTDISNLVKDLKAYSDALVAYNKRVGAVETKQGRLNSDIAAINDAIQAILRSITAINGEITQLKSVDAAHQQAISKNANDIAAIKQKNTQQDQAISDLGDRADQNRAEIDAVGDKASDISSSLKDYVKKEEVYGGTSAHGSMLGKIPRVATNGVMGITHILDRKMASGGSVRETTQYNASVGGNEIYNNGRYNCVDIYIRSDLRDKSEIVSIRPEDGDRILREIGTGISYRLLSEKTRTAGLSAQRVQQVMPEAIVVGTNEEGEERLSLRQGALVGALVSGYNYQAKRIAALEDRLNERNMGFGTIFKMLLLKLLNRRM